MALQETEKLDGSRAIVIEDVPPGTGILDLIGAFSPFGAIRSASVGPPAVVCFETEASAAHALLVAFMKSVSLLGAISQKNKLQVPAAAPVVGASPGAEPETSPNEAPTEATAPENRPTADNAVKSNLDSVIDDIFLEHKKRTDSIIDGVFLEHQKRIDTMFLDYKKRVGLRE